jgi:hypothetical protein
MGLSFYIQDTRALLNDQNAQFVSNAQLVRWINESRRQAALRSGCIMRLISGQSAFGASAQPGQAIPGGMQPGALPGSFPVGTGILVANAATNSLQTIPGVERYPFQGFWNPYAADQYAGIKGIIDVANLSINWGGALRPSIAWMPWDELQAYARAYATLVTSYPYFWSVLDDGENGETWLFPAPSTTGDMEAMAYCVPKDIYSDADYDAIPPGFQNAIKYYAASLAYLGKNRFADAEIMENRFNSSIGVSSVARDRGKQANYYFANV